MRLLHLKRAEINDREWDNIVRHAYNGVIFAYSWYLDIVCEEWEALATESYDFIMPLPVKHVLNTSFVYHPPFVNELGIFSNKPITTDVVELFLQAIPYPYYSIRLNVYNNLPPEHSYHVQHQNSYRMDLVRSHSWFKRAYQGKLKARLVQAISSNVAVQQGIQPATLVDFLQNGAIPSQRLPHDEISKIRKLAVNAIRYRAGLLYGAYSQHNMLSAVAFFTVTHHKIHLMACAVSAEGLENNALCLLLDYFLEQNAESTLTADMERMAACGFQELAQELGAKAFLVSRISQNKPPWYLKVLKF